MKKSTNKFLRLLFLSVMLWMTMSAQGKAAELAPVQEEEAEFARESQAQEKEAESALQEGEVSPVTEGLVWQEDHYVLYEGGVQVTAEGWKELSAGIFYIDRKSCCCRSRAHYRNIFRRDSGRREPSETGCGNRAVSTVREKIEPSCRHGWDCAGGTGSIWKYETG